MPCHSYPRILSLENTYNLSSTCSNENIIRLNRQYRLRSELYYQKREKSHNLTVDIKMNFDPVCHSQLACEMRIRTKRYVTYNRRNFSYEIERSVLTFAPCTSKVRVISSPIPLAPPVTTATAPSIFILLAMNYF